MFQENEKEWILEAINHLKHRKARPDLSRISLRMKRKHQMSFAQTKKLLESLIESGIVVKAVYKNNTSYRDVSKWKKGRLGGHILNSSKMLQRFIRAIEAREKTKGTGVSAKDIEDHLGGQDEEKCFLAGAALKDALENEISNGFLKKFSFGTVVHYVVNTDIIKNVSQLLAVEEQPQESDRELSDDSEINVANSEIEHLLPTIITVMSQASSLERDGLSVKDVQTHLSTKGLGSAVDGSLLMEFFENKVKENVFIKNEKGPVKLYKLNEKKVKGERENEIAKITQNADVQEVPEIKENVDAFSLHAPPVITSGIASRENGNSSSVVPLRPPSKRKRTKKDHGPDFEIEMPTRMKIKNTENKDHVYPTPTHSPSSEKSDSVIHQSFKFDGKKKRGRPKKVPSSFLGQQTEMELMEDDNSKQGAPSEISSICNEEDEDDRAVSPSIPDISSWTAQQVSDYFAEKGYSEEAQSMLEHGLDGTALALLRRSDIVGPPLGGILQVKKLGVALKLFRDIRDLLYHGNADNYEDPYEERAFVRS